MVRGPTTHRGAPAPRGPATGGFDLRKVIKAVMADSKLSKGLDISVASDTRKVSSFVSSGAPSLDAAIGVGGYPGARIIIAHGKESSGKTTLALHGCRSAQEAGGAAIFGDVENALDLDYAEKFVDLDKLGLFQPPHIERGFDLMERLIVQTRKDLGEGPPIFVVWDSLQAAESLQGEKAGYEKGTWSPESRAYSKVFRKIPKILRRNDATLFSVSQVRMTSGVGKFAPPREKIGVGQAPMFYASVIIDTRPFTPKKGIASKIKLDDGFWLCSTCRKNKVSAPWRTAVFPIRYGIGIDRMASALVLAETLGLAKLLSKGRCSLIAGEEEHEFLISRAEQYIEDRIGLDLLCAELAQYVRDNPLPAGSIKKEISSLEDVFDDDEEDGPVAKIAPAEDEDEEEQEDSTDEDD